MRKTLLLFVCTACLLFLVACSKEKSIITQGGALSVEDDTFLPQTTLEEVTDIAETKKSIQPSCDELKPAEGTPLEKASFYIDGVKIAPGCTVEQICGQVSGAYWEWPRNADKKAFLQPNEFANLYLWVNSDSLNISICNNTSEVLPIEQSIMYGFVMEDEHYRPGFHGLTVKSTIDDFVSVFGKPYKNKENIYPYSTFYTWVFHEDEQLVAIKFIPKKNSRKPEKVLVDYVIFDRHYLFAKYDLPFSINGVEYLWEDSVAALFENMTIVSGFKEMNSGFLAPNQTSPGYLKDSLGNEYSIQVINETSETLPFMSCTLDYLHVRRYKTVPDIAILGVPVFTSSLFDMEEVLAHKVKGKNDGMTTYSCKGIEPDSFEVFITMRRNDDTDEVQYITIGR